MCQTSGRCQYCQLVEEPKWQAAPDNPVYVGGPLRLELYAKIIEFHSNGFKATGLHRVMENWLLWECATWRGKNSQASPEHVTPVVVGLHVCDAPSH